LNLYRMVRNNPMTLKDEKGTDPEDAIKNDKPTGYRSGIFGGITRSLLPSLPPAVFPAVSVSLESMRHHEQTTDLRNPFSRAGSSVNNNMPSHGIDAGSSIHDATKFERHARIVMNSPMTIKDGNETDPGVPINRGGLTGYFSEAAGIFKRSLFLNPNPVASVSPEREYLDKEVRDLDNEFAKMVNGVNRNMASYGEDPLPKWKAKAYARDAKKVEEGKISRAGAFSSSASGWLIEGNIVGIVMNTGGALFAGVIDHREHVTGRSMRHPEN
ncbi:hypothetical protein LQR30_23020, partial [Chromobacterium piscinae]|uniref:hypothetical protein n=1 Tax=Chromobacterium piscinae TaxID=686831 RepID=UPI001E54BAE2